MACYDDSGDNDNENENGTTPWKSLIIIGQTEARKNKLDGDELL